MNTTERKNSEQVSWIVATLPSSWVTLYLGKSNNVYHKQYHAICIWESQQVAQSSLRLNSNDGKSSMFLSKTSEKIKMKINMKKWMRVAHLVLQSLFHDGQIRPAWCSSRRSHCCRECWPGLCLVGTSHRPSCQCRTRLWNQRRTRKVSAVRKKEGKTTKKKHAKETIVVNIQLKSCLCRLVSWVYTVYCTSMFLLQTTLYLCVQSDW